MESPPFVATAAIALVLIAFLSPSGTVLGAEIHCFAPAELEQRSEAEFPWGPQPWAGTPQQAADSICQRLATASRRWIEDPSGKVTRATESSPEHEPLFTVTEDRSKAVVSIELVGRGNYFGADVLVVWTRVWLGSEAHQVAETSQREPPVNFDKAERAWEEALSRTVIRLTGFLLGRQDELGL